MGKKESKLKLKKVFSEYLIFNNKGKMVPLLKSKLGKELFEECLELIENQHPTKDKVSKEADAYSDKVSENFSPSGYAVKPLKEIMSAFIYQGFIDGAEYFRNKIKKT